MLIMGLTGGIASGKSLVARVFKDLGAYLIDADRVVHELLEPGQQAWREVAGYFGGAVLLQNSCIDRRKLGEIVFQDAAKREWLNHCLHPRVFEVYTAQVKNIRSRQPRAVIVLDAALLIETGYYRKMDKLVVVNATLEQQIERLTLRDKFTREQAQSRIQSQMPLNEKLAFADYIADNTGTREETERQARDIFTKLTQEAERA